LVWLQEQHPRRVITAKATRHCKNLSLCRTFSEN